MNFKKILLLVAAAVLCGSLSAQRVQRNAAKDDVDAVVKNYADSLAQLRQQLDSLQQLNAQLSRQYDGRYYRLFAPFTFYHSGANKSLSLAPDAGDEVTDAVDAAMLNLYLRRPDLVTNDESRLREAGSVRVDVEQPITHQVELAEQAPSLPDEQPVLPTGLIITKPNFWKFSGDYYLQFLQNYISDNWYKGGESNYSAVGAVTLQLNYNNKQKVKFDNKLEMKLGFLTSRSDSVHTFKSNSDLLRYTGKLGLQASNHWYYTLQVLAYTQFSRGLKSNDRTVYSDFMSPFNLNVGLGMDYNVETKNKRLTGNINLSPLSYNLRYVDRKVLATRYGIDNGSQVMHDLGSQLTVDLEWKMSDQVAWKTRLYAYTSYKRAEVEWENTLAMKISKYITTNIFLYPRFDDAGNRDKKLGYWQFQEYCSLGFAYSF